MQPPPTVCRFETKGFAALGTPVFRLTEGDKVAAMALQLDGSEALHAALARKAAGRDAR